ncbi:uncharacterized protein TNCV_5030301 [Trichonephila clavipes]|nr:uncharacterized protein TNCV_5030301 [Trichonephila clavipes]
MNNLPIFERILIANYLLKIVSGLDRKIAYCGSAKLYIGSNLFCCKLKFIPKLGRGSLVVKVSDRGWHVTSSSPVPLKTRLVGERCPLNLSRAQTSSRWCGSSERGMPAQVLSSSLDHGSKLRGLSPKALV